MTSDALKELLRSDLPAEREKAIAYLVEALTAHEMRSRKKGYELLNEALKDALYQSCLHYGSLPGAFAEPTMAVVTRTIETWAERRTSPQMSAPDIAR